jgi:hypothetical protein
MYRHFHSLDVFGESGAADALKSTHYIACGAVMSGRQRTEAISLMREEGKI